MRVAEDDVFAPDETEQEAEHDLGDAVALGLVESRDLVESQPVDVLRDDHEGLPEQRDAGRVLGIDSQTSSSAIRSRTSLKQRSGVATGARRWTIGLTTATGRNRW